MPLFRYRLKDEFQGMYFWEWDRVTKRMEEVRNAGVNWFVSQEHIRNLDDARLRHIDFSQVDYVGLTPNYAIVEFKLFFTQFYVRKCHLLLIESRDNPRIVDAKFPFAALMGVHAGVKEISGLIHFLRADEPAHVFCTSVEHDGRSPKMMTFSRRPPPPELYIPVGEVPIEYRADEQKRNVGVDYLPHTDHVVSKVIKGSGR